MTQPAPPGPSEARRRVRLTALGGLVLLVISWRWGHAEMTRWSFLPGAVLTSGGLLLRLWAEGWLIKNQVLSTRGPYSFTRNPLYLGTGLIILGQSLMSGVPWAPVVFPALWLALYWPTMRQEEAHLAARYGVEHAAYRKRVPLLLPRLRPMRDEAVPVANDEERMEEQKFSWSRVFRYRWVVLSNVLLMIVYGVLHATR